MSEALRRMRVRLLGPGLSTTLSKLAALAKFRSLCSLSHVSDDSWLFCTFSVAFSASGVNVNSGALDPAGASLVSDRARPPVRFQAFQTRIVPSQLPEMY